MKGYAYIEKDRVVVNEKPKPKESDYLLGMAGVDNYKKALSAWEDSLIEVENVIHGKWLYKPEDTYQHYRRIEDGQPVDFTLSGKKATINKIL